MHKLQFCLIWKLIKDRSGIKSALAPSAMTELSPKLSFDTRTAHYRAGRQKMVGKLKVPSFQQSSWKVREPHSF